MRTILLSVIFIVIAYKVGYEQCKRNQKPPEKIFLEQVMKHVVTVVNVGGYDSISDQYMLVNKTIALPCFFDIKSDTILNIDEPIYLIKL